MEAGSAPRYPRSSRGRLSATSSTHLGKMLLTDFCNRLHDTSTRKSFGFRVSDFRLDEPPRRLSCDFKASGTIAKVAPGCLAASWPRMDARLTSHTELRALPAHSLPSFLEEGRAPLRAMLPLPQRFRPWARLTASTSDALCRAPRPSGNPNACEVPEPAFTDRASTRPAFPAQSAFHRQVLPRARFREERFFGSPPPIPRLCRLRFGFRCRFASVKALAPGS